MKRLFHFAAACALLVWGASSCAPSAYVLSLESRLPSSSGIDLEGRSISVIYLQSEDGSDSLFNNRVADALAYTLEEDYFDGAEGISVYNLVKDPEGQYATVDTASTYVMLLDSDVVMILDTPEVGNPVGAAGTIPVKSNLYIYDSLGGEDDGLSHLQCTIGVPSLSDANKPLNLGASLAMPLVGQWKQEEYPVLYFEEAIDSRWLKALDLAYDLKWPEAMDIWMELVDKSNSVMASAARYNVALGCMMKEEYDLAKEWLDLSDKAMPLSISKGLRKDIDNKQKAAEEKSAAE